MTYRELLIKMLQSTLDETPDFLDREVVGYIEMGDSEKSLPVRIVIDDFEDADPPFLVSRCEENWGF